jgi:hypothetical protein
MSVSVNKLFGLEGDKWMRHANPLLFPRPARPATGPPGRVRRAHLDLLPVVSGLVILQTPKAWFIDRMVLLFEHMKAGNPEYAAWSY